MKDPVCRCSSVRHAVVVPDSCVHVRFQSSCRPPSLPAHVFPVRSQDKQPPFQHSTRARFKARSPQAAARAVRMRACSVLPWRNLFPPSNYIVCSGSMSALFSANPRIRCRRRARGEVEEDGSPSPQAVRVCGVLAAVTPPCCCCRCCPPTTPLPRWRPSRCRPTVRPPRRCLAPMPLLSSRHPYSH